MALFRKEVVEKQTQRLYGEVRLDTPLSHWTITLLLSLLFIGLLIFLVFASYTRKQTVIGWLAPDKGLVRIVSSQEGVIQEVHAKEGDVVAAGARLVTLDFDNALTDGRSAATVKLESLNAQYNEVYERLAPLQKQYDAKERQLRTRIESLKVELAAVQQQERAQKQRVKIADQVLGRYRALAAEDNASDIEVLEHEEALLILTQNQTQLGRERLAITRQIEEAEGVLVDLPGDRQAAASELRNQLETLSRQRAEYEASRSIVLTAPVAGSIAAAPLRKGQTAGGGRMLMALIPEGGYLQVELFVPTSAAGFVKSGQDVNLRLDAFPHQKFGVVRGTVNTISRSVYNPSELPISVALEEPVYSVTVDIEEQSISFNDDRFPLQAGMLLKADILLERRRMWRLLQSGT
ncbi:MAG: HlyD family efflux transporter periplasmic adaptor subunit [Pseudomonadota bacterium]